MLVGRYRFVALLGRGGMGEVYRADDMKLGQSVALKFLPHRFVSDPERLSRFLNEVRTARQVAHPNVCRVYDVGEAEGEHFLSMEFVQGEDLATLLRRIGRLPGDKALQIARQICAGLAAAHERGVIHRDLKPANVMLDERGTARITDFGLAGAVEDFEGESAREGTPAYMAPEQLAGRHASARSDVYSLGLLLYELFTGKPAFSADTLAELLRMREQTTPTNPSSHVSDMDPAVERAILRCLESEPLKRPATAALVAAALPGGDPLAAAIAAGETPSPEMVAAAGGEGALSPRVAWSFLAAVVGILTLLHLLSPVSTDLGLAPFSKSPDALTERGQDLARAFGYTAAAADRGFGFRRNYDFLAWRAGHIPSPERERGLASARPGSICFYYRQSPRAMIPTENFDALLSHDDPPMVFSGMISVELDRQGRLTRFVAVPPQISELTSPPGSPDWSVLFAAAGLDAAQFKSAPPKWLAPFPFDSRAAWDGSSPEASGVPIRVEAAAFQGKPVYFEMLGPWSRPERMQEAQTASSRIASASVFAVVVLVLCAGGLMARRNLRLGRGDRAGAFRASGVIFALSVTTWILAGHHVAGVGEFPLMITAFSGAGFNLLIFCVMYLALEPYVRRCWPGVLISWNRVVAGKFRDPLVGRDLLVGLLSGAVAAATYHLVDSLPAWMNVSGLTPMPPGELKLRGIASLLGQTASFGVDSIVVAFVLLFVVFVAFVVLRRRPLAIAAGGIVFVLVRLPGENLAIELPMTAIVAAIFFILLFRFGIFSLAGALFAEGTLSRNPFTLDPSCWYFGLGMFTVAIVLGLAVYGFHTALGGQKAFGGLSLEE
jgi:serine/threonine-protein kinase